MIQRAPCQKTPTDTISRGRGELIGTDSSGEARMVDVGEEAEID